MNNITYIKLTYGIHELKVKKKIISACLKDITSHLIFTQVNLKYTVVIWIFNNRILKNFWNSNWSFVAMRKPNFIFFISTLIYKAIIHDMYIYKYII